MKYICALLLLWVPVYGEQELISSTTEEDKAVIRNNMVTGDAPVEQKLKALTIEQYQYINDIITKTENTRDGFSVSYGKIASFLETLGLKENGEYAIFGLFRKAEDIARGRVKHGRRSDDYLPCLPRSFLSFLKGKGSDKGRLNERAFECVVSNGYYLSVVAQ